MTGLWHCGQPWLSPTRSGEALQKILQKTKDSYQSGVLSAATFNWLQSYRYLPTSKRKPYWTQWYSKWIHLQGKHLLVLQECCIKLGVSLIDPTMYRMAIPGWKSKILFSFQQQIKDKEICRNQFSFIGERVRVWGKGYLNILCNFTVRNWSLHEFIDFKKKHIVSLFNLKKGNHCKKEKKT